MVGEDGVERLECLVRQVKWGEVGIGEVIKFGVSRFRMASI